MDVPNCLGFDPAEAVAAVGGTTPAAPPSKYVKPVVEAPAKVSVTSEAPPRVTAEVAVVVIASSVVVTWGTAQAAKLKVAVPVAALNGIEIPLKPGTPTFSEPVT